MNRFTIGVVTIACLVALPTAAQAELRHVEIKTLGMD
jgi:hypothetical protein